MKRYSEKEYQKARQEATVRGFEMGRKAGRQELQSALRELLNAKEDGNEDR